MGRLLTAIEGANKACRALTDSPTQYPPTHQLRMELLPDVTPRSDVQQTGIWRQGESAGVLVKNLVANIAMT